MSKRLFISGLSSAPFAVAAKAAAELGEDRSPTNGGLPVDPRTRPLPGRDPYIANVRDFGAIGDGVTDDSAAFVAAQNYLEARRSPGLPGVDPVMLATIYVPPGRYVVRQSEAILSSSFKSKTRGFRMLGGGIGATVVHFSPTGGSKTLLFNNNSYLTSDIRDITFLSRDPDAIFMSSFAHAPAGAPQGWSFLRVGWVGSWSRVFSLTGNNNNSEWTFFNCEVGGRVGDFVYVPDDETGSDQFLNFWWSNGKFWTYDGSLPSCMFNMGKGGSIAVSDSDFSGLMNATLFRLKGASHAQGVCKFIARGNRYELRSDKTKVIECNWPSGIVTFEDEDYSSQAGPYASSAVTHSFRIAVTSGPQVTFSRCNLVGTHEYSHGTNSFELKSRVRYQACDHAQLVDFYECIRMLPSTNDVGSHLVQVEDSCRGQQRTVFGQPVWAQEKMYATGSTIRNHNSVYQALTGGRSSSVEGPTGKSSLITDGEITWAFRYNQGRDYVTGSVVGGADYSRPPVQRRLVAFGGGLPNYGSWAAWAEIILPPNVRVVAAGILMPNEVNGAASGQHLADYLIRMENGFTLLTASTRGRGGTLTQIATGLNVPTDTEIASRTVILVAEVARGSDRAGKGLAYVEYIG